MSDPETKAFFFNDPLPYNDKDKRLIDLIENLRSVVRYLTMTLNEQRDARRKTIDNNSSK